jgi:predicted P-loop ATPase
MIWLAQREAVLFRKVQDKNEERKSENPIYICLLLQWNNQKRMKHICLGKDNRSRVI